MSNSETKVGNMSASAMIQQPAPLQQDGNLASNWKEWKSSFDYFLIAAGKDSAPSKEKCGLFMHVIGKYGREIYEELDVTEEIKQEYSSLCIKFAEHCDPTKNINYERHMFFETYQHNNDFDKYLGELKLNSKNCEFGSLRNSLILTQMIRGLKDKNMREKLLAKIKLSLEEAIQWCRAAERAGRQGAACEASAARAAGSSAGAAAASVEQVARGAPTRARRRARPATRARHPGPHGTPASGFTSSRSDVNRSPGSVCGKCAYQHASDRCPASSARCRRCQRVGHFAKCCRVRIMNEVQERHDDSCGEECGDYDTDPLYPLRFFPGAIMAPLIGNFFQTAFLAVVMISWLSQYHGLRQNDRGLVSFYLFKFVLVGLCVIPAFMLGNWQKFSSYLDPTYNYMMDPDYPLVKLWFFCAITIYFLYLIILIIKAYSDLRNMPFFDIRLRCLSIVVGTVTSIITILALQGWGPAALQDHWACQPKIHFDTSAPFMALYGLFNFYIYILAYLFSPGGGNIHETAITKDNPAFSMINDSDEEVIYGSDEESRRPLNSHHRITTDEDL